MSMERVKEIEKELNDLPESWYFAERIRFLIDTVKQQNEQIEELEQANARGNGHVKACEGRIEYLEKALHEIVNIYHNAIPVVAPNDMKKVAEQALNK